MPSTHIIRRQFLDVELVGTESDGLALQHTLTTLCRDWLMPALDRVLERALPADQHWILDRLEIDAGSFSRENLERDLVDAVSLAVERRLKDRIPWTPSSNAQVPDAAAGQRLGHSAGSDWTDLPDSSERRTQTQAVEHALVHFLDTGLLPWWFSLPAGVTLEEAVRESWQTPPRALAGVSRSLAAALASPSARTRLVRQFSAGFLALLLARVSEAKLSAVEEILAALNQREPASETHSLFRALVWQAAFAPGESATAGALVTAVLDEAPATGMDQVTPALRDLIGRVWPKARPHQTAGKAMRRASTSDTATPSTRADRGRQGPPIELEEGVFIGCAGVVLLHPFLPRLFEGVGIATDDRLMAPDRALGLLHFLATGQSTAPEYELLLPKILCNLPLDVPVGPPVELSAAEIEEANALLSAVIGHWTALGDASIDGLRGSFLARPGKLSRRSAAEDLLQVEPRAYDILLDRLPWGIGMIQLPWMEKLLRVEWRF